MGNDNYIEKVVDVDIKDIKDHYLGNKEVLKQEDID